MATVNVDLPAETKEKVVEELKKNKCEMDSQTPIGCGPFGYVYRARRLVEGDLITVKVVLIPKVLDSERNALLRLIEQEVFRFK